ncbi:MAG: hypothetical protein ACKVHE_36590, partial [Planctomycetales bacterium]
FLTLEPWQRQWVACRSAMRVLPAVGGFASSSFWTDPTFSVVAIAKLPWLISLSWSFPNLVSEYSEISSEAYSAYSDANTFDEDAAKAAAHAAFASHATDQYEAYSEHVNHASGATHFSTEVLSDSMSFPREVYFAATADVNWIRSWSDRPYLDPTDECWQEFYGRGLWEPEIPWPVGWDSVIGKFRKAVNGIGLGDLADQYAVHCHEGANFEDIQQWLFGEVRVPLHDEQSPQLPENDNWWMQLLYRIGLEDRGRLNLLVQLRADDVESALMDCIRRSEQEETRAKNPTKASTRSDSEIESVGIEFAVGRWPKRTEIAAVAERLEKQFGHLNPPPLWTAWFQAVHGDELRKIREHFAREPH